jgi:glycosyltransferase involved in cell wall biosynthesis
MILDVIIPTFNRHLMLRRTLDSLLSAERPSHIDVRVTVVDNNSTDATKATVEGYAESFRDRLKYVFEPRQGRSFALNAGIAATDGDLVGMIDDDEEIEKGWYRIVHSMFSQGGIDFIGGPYVPRWGADRPDWLPMSHLGAIGWIDGGDSVVAFDQTYPGILMGGNAVLTRAILKKVGCYNTSLGRNGMRLLAGEDEEMYQRLLATGARGLYVPGLIIYHYVPPERLTKRYFRRWCFWRGVSAGLMDRDWDRRMPVVYFGGIPRYLYGEAARGLREVLRSTFNKRRKGSAGVFSSELGVWNAVGFFYGKHFYRAGGSGQASATDQPMVQNCRQPALCGSKLNRLAQD